LFSGAGGLDLGFEQQGFEPILAYDIKSVAVETYNFNRSTKKLAKVANLNSYKIADMILEDIRLLGPSNKPIGIVGGPPCQYFSNGNKTLRKARDTRRLLPYRYVSILHKLNKECHIDFFILENVDGLVHKNHLSVFKKLLKLFDGAGFHTTWKILDAYNFGVPQHRKRVFIIGWNKQFYPAGTYQFPQGQPCGLTVQDAIGSLGDPVYYQKKLNPEDFSIHPNHWTMVPRSKKFSNPPPEDLGGSVRSFRRLAWNKPGYTVAYGHNEIHVHPSGKRRLSIYESMILQGFPRAENGYRLLGSLTEQVSLISDAVPPPMASAIAASMKEFIHLHKNAQKK
jgi:DNA (cytosine-5)-methyltransferase 1